ncbi:hypothetical protein GQ43DRAFT_363156, partial [Delitschia confertaspora ATCC 74209]
ILILACADICKQYQCPLTSNPITLVAAGGISDGWDFVASLLLGANGLLQLWSRSILKRLRNNESPFSPPKTPPPKTFLFVLSS